QRKRVGEGIFGGETVFVDVCRLLILRPDRIRAGGVELGRKTIFDREWCSGGRYGWNQWLQVGFLGEGWARGQALIECVALEKAGCSVTATDHEPRACMVSETETRHELIPGRFVAGLGGAHDGARDRSVRYAPGILNDPAIQQNVRRLV